MKIAELRYYLSHLSKNELETLIVELFKRNAFNKDLLETKIKPENKKISKTPELLADLMLYYVENGVEFTNEYGDIDEDFYLKIENMFSNALNNGAIV